MQRSKQTLTIEALRITRELITQKLAGQERVARTKLLDSRTATPQPNRTLLREIHASQNTLELRVRAERIEHWIHFETQQRVIVMILIHFL